MLPAIITLYRLLEVSWYATLLHFLYAYRGMNASLKRFKEVLS